MSLSGAVGLGLNSRMSMVGPGPGYRPDRPNQISVLERGPRETLIATSQSPSIIGHKAMATRAVYSCQHIADQLYARQIGRLSVRSADRVREYLVTRAKA